MKSRLSPRSERLFAPAALTLLAAGALPAGAQVKLPPIQFEEAEKSGYFVRLGPRVQFNVEATVAMSPQTPQQPGNYDNGFVLPDVGGTASGLTWNWGYADASQLVGDAINYERYSNLPHAGVFTSGSDDPLLGGEVIFGVEFGRFNIGSKELGWGVELGYSFTPFKLTDTSSTSGTVDYLAATHGLGGIVPPVAPYQGTFNGPGPVIDLNPTTSTTTSSAATSAFDGTLESDLHLVKIGLWLELPLTQTISASLSLGYSSVFADTRFDFREAIAIANPGIPALGVTDASTGASEWQGGFYGELRATWQFSKYVGAYVAGDYMYNSGFGYNEAGREISLDFNSSYSASLGLVFSW
jgi:hypothetical protein